ncbi:hypothetical protein DEO72_LG3g2045 [Vigna unguiculata]|uniref:Uncharacterized protein n=1 Tax=Vigna unguiculata TaxID=3917 RepID=A0A4D6LFS3_VIGUN|nr:hypothetical protein DEO72_LG3g2045 [Vigna unguiculata]
MNGKSDTCGDSLSVRESALRRRRAARCAPPGGDGKAVGLGGSWRLAVSEYCQAVWNSFAWRRVGRARRKRCCSLLSVTLTWGYERGRVVCSVLTLRDATCGEVRGLVDHMCWTTGGQVRRVGLRAGSSPFLFVCGDDRVIRYTGADIDTGGAEDAQMAE